MIPIESILLDDGLGDRLDIRSNPDGNRGPHCCNIVRKAILPNLRRRIETPNSCPIL
jgi:hypothetical protein